MQATPQRLGLYNLQWKASVIKFTEALQRIIKRPAIAPDADCRCQIGPDPGADVCVHLKVREYQFL